MYSGLENNQKKWKYLDLENRNQKFNSQIHTDENGNFSRFSAVNFQRDEKLSKRDKNGRKNES